MGFVNCPKGGWYSPVKRSTPRKRKPKGAKHHSARPGRLVKAVLRDGSVVLGTFKRSNKRFLLLEGHSRISWEKVRKFGYLPYLRGSTSP